MSLLQFVVLIAGVVFLIFGVDLYKRKKMNILHFVVFSGGGIVIALFALNPLYLDKFGRFFGIARGADLMVYISLILIFYFYMEIVNKLTKDKQELSRLISAMAIRDAYEDHKEIISKISNKDNKDEYIFNIRSYNEAKALPKVIDEIYKAGFSKILIVNDGSKDNTLDLLKKKKAEYPDKTLIVVSHEINRGGGAANQTGFSFVKKYGEELKINRLVGYDADGQMDIHDMNSFMRKIENVSVPKDLYLGSRFLKESKTENMPMMRRFILFLSRVVTFVFYGAQVSDPHSGYRVISLPALRKFDLTSDGMHYANEFNEQMKKNKLKYEEVPVHIRYTDYSLAKGQKNSNSIKLAAEMIYRKIFFR